MVHAYCNSPARTVKTCGCQRFRRTVFLGLLVFAVQVVHAGQLPKATAIVPAVSEEDNAAAFAVSESLGIYQDKTNQQAALTEAQSKKPGDADIAAKLKAIDEDKAAIIVKAEESVQKFPRSGKVIAAGAAVVLQSGDFKKGLAYADRAVSLAEAKPDDPKSLASALRVRATGELWSGDYPKAAADAKRVLSMFPDDKAARSIYEMSRNRTKAGAVAIASAGSRPLPNALVENSLLDDPRLKRAGARAGDRAGANRLAAEAMRRINLGDGAGALAAANAVVEVDPTLADGYMMRGLAYTILKEFAQALREFTKAIDLWSAQGKTENLPVAYGRRAEAANEARDYPNALRDAETSVQGDSGLGLGYFERARANEGLGEKGEKILADFKRAAELSPQYAADYASARTRLSGAAPEAPPRKGGMAKAAAAGASALAMLLAFVAWRRSARGRPEASIGFAEERKELDAQYDIVSTLGEGGMGMVYKGWDKVLKRPVAVKRLRTELQASPRERDRFVKEAEMVASLHHPHIVDIYTIIRDATDTYLVFEYVSGMTLHELLNETPGRRLPAKRALEIMRQICEAVDHAHARHVIHRDMKPSNVMLADGGWVKVMDFGIARQILDSLLTTTNTIVGTPVYMAPEQAMGAVVKESDIFALGITLYELLTGALPFRGPGEMNDKLECRFTPPSELAPELGPEIDAVVRKALAPKPEDRYHLAGELYAAAAGALRGRVTPVA